MPVIRPRNFVPAILILGCAALAQQPPAPNTQPPVYIVEFSQSLAPELERDFEQLNKFTTGLVQLRLLQVPSLTIHRVQAPVACGLPPAAQAPAEQQPTLVPPGDFYEVEGAIRSDLPQITMSYSVRKCEAGHFRTVLQDAEPFTLDRAFDQIAIVADAIAFKIEQVTPPTQIAVSPFSVEGESPQPPEMNADLRSAIVAELQKSSDYEVADSGDFKLVGRLTLKRQNGGGAQSGPVGIKAEMQIVAHGKPYPLRQVSGSGDQLQKFYKAVSEEVARALPEVLIAENLQLPGMLESMKTDELLNEAERLLAQCSASETECSSARDAVTLLASPAGKDPAPWKLLFLYGKAQTLAGRPGDAIATLKNAGDRLPPIGGGSEAERVQTFNQLGDAYRSAGRYDDAAGAYTDSLALDSTQILVYKSLAEALEFQNQRSSALETLIRGLKECGAGPECDPLHRTAKNLILSVQIPAELQSLAGPVVDARKASLPVNDEYALLIARKWTLTLDSGWDPQRKNEIEGEMQTALSLKVADPEIQAWVFGTAARVALLTGDSAQVHMMVAATEQLPSDRVPANLREWVERIAAQDYYYAAQYDKAAASADRAYRIQPTDSAIFLMANANFMQARCMERVWKTAQASPTPQFCARAELLHEVPLQSEGLTPDRFSELERSYADVISRLAPLVAKRFTAADYTYMRANHSLGNDRATLAQFREFAAKDPTDRNAWDVTIYICSQYLFDFDCAFTAASSEQALFARTGTFTSRDYLNISETAVLKGNRPTALQWLDIAGNQKGITAGDDALVHLYRLWTLMLGGVSAEELKREFDAWTTAASKFREGDEDIGWIFDGAKMALNQSKPSLGNNKVALLTSMIDVLEHPKTQLPAWPASGQI